MPEPVAGLRRPVRWLILLAGFALVAASVMTTAEVVIRRLFNTSFAGADEISGYVLAGVSAWSFAYAALVKSHIRIDSLIRLLPRLPRAVLDLAAQASLLGFAVVLTYHASGVLAFTIERGSRSQTPLGLPLAVPQSIWVIGLAAFVCASAVVLALALIRALRRDWNGVTAVLDSNAVDDEIASAGERRDESRRP